MNIDRATIQILQTEKNTYFLCFQLEILTYLICFLPAHLMLTLYHDCFVIPRHPMVAKFELHSQGIIYSDPIMTIAALARLVQMLNIFLITLINFYIIIY